jgi:hypothetical protein
MPSTTGIDGSLLGVRIAARRLPTLSRYHFLRYDCIKRRAVGTGKGCEAGMPSRVVESARSRCYLELATEGKETVYVIPLVFFPV